MGLSPEQIKGRIKHLAKQNDADARILLRVYMMERFLERVANSKYRDIFIIKGGILVTSMVGVALRSTMDVDTSLVNHDLSEDETKRILLEVTELDLNDGVTFEIKEMSHIMDDMEYPGIRFSMNALMGKMTTPMKIDISTGDVITPHAIEYQYQLMLENRVINLRAYNLETILSEKIQTILSRGLLNTRMRDFYDIYVLLLLHEKDIDKKNIIDAFQATCEHRGTLELLQEGPSILNMIGKDNQLRTRWMAYQKKYPYAGSIQYEAVLKSARALLDKIL